MNNGGDKWASFTNKLIANKNPKEEIALSSLIKSSFSNMENLD